MKTTIFFFALISSLSASAVLLFEPYLGYNKGQEQTNSVQGIGFGLRLGVDFHDVFVAGDLDYSDLQMGSVSSVKFTNTGIDLGFRIQNVRAWYGVISNAQLSYASATGTVVTKGTGTKLGVGFQISSNLNMDMEVRTLNYTTSDAGAGAGAVPVTELATIGFLGVGWLY